jgi:hypothetical protein
VCFINVVCFDGACVAWCFGDIGSIWLMWLENNHITKGRSAVWLSYLVSCRGGDDVVL